MMTSNWDELPKDGIHACDAGKPEMLKRMQQIVETHDMAIITHSLGSRATIDALQLIATRLQELQTPEAQRVAQVLKQQEMPVYMLANQLALLQLGSTPPPITGQRADYCSAGGKNFEQRLFTKTQIVAFNDPNDLLSFPIDNSFSSKYLDSRICADVTNVMINVTPAVTLPLIGAVANPMDAHTEYEVDARVIKLIADGVSSWENEQNLPEGCNWMETR